MTMEMAQVFLILQMLGFFFFDSRLYLVASGGHSYFFFMLCFYMLFPLTSPGRNVYMGTERGRSLLVREE